MAQAVAPVPNPDFSVKPLTTVAGSIVSRRQIKVPVNNPNDYGSNKSNKPSVATWDIADNECFVDLYNIVLCADITTAWSDQYLSPLLDAGTSGLIARLSIGTSQGLILETIPNYSLWSSIVQSYTVDAQRKERDLLDGYNTVTTLDKEKGMCSFYDSPGAYMGNVYLDPKNPQRLHIRFHHSSFTSSARYLPLFLLRNGIRIEVEFENVYKAFNYSISPNISSMQKIRFTDFTPRYSTGTIGTCIGDPNFFVSSGNQYLNGSLTAFQESTAQADTVVGTIWQPNMSNKLHATNSGYGMRSIHTIWFKRSVAYDIFLKLIGNPIIGNTALSATTRAAYTQHCVPVYIRERGVLTFYALLTASPIDYSQADFISQADTDTYRNSLSRVDNFTTPTTTQNGTSCTLSRNFDIATKTFDFQNLAGGTVTGKNLYVPFNLEVPADKTPYWRSVINQTGFNQQFQYMVDRGTELCIDWGSKFTCANNTTYGNTVYAANPSIKAFEFLPVHPMIATSMVPEIATTGWDYTLKNLELQLDLIKPSADVFQQFTTQFGSPSGIPISYKRVLYQQQSINSIAGGQVQFSLPYSIRSMLGVIIVLTDQCFGHDTTDMTKTTYPMLSSFQRRGLTRAEFIVGGQTFPVYPMWVRKTSDGSENTLGQLIELERCFGVKNTLGFNPNFSEDQLRDTRNYLMCGPFDMNSSSLDDTTAGSYAKSYYTSISNELTSAGKYTATTVASTPSILDTSKFVLGWSVAKNDINSFTTGIDTTQSGTLNVNLYFDDTDPMAWTQRKTLVHFYVIADATATFQSAANLVRY